MAAFEHNTQNDDSNEFSSGYHFKSFKNKEIFIQILFYYLVRRATGNFCGQGVYSTEKGTLKSVNANKYWDNGYQI